MGYESSSICRNWVITSHGYGAPEMPCRSVLSVPSGPDVCSTSGRLGGFGQLLPVTLFRRRGTHRASLLGETPTLRTVALDGITIYRFENGLIAEDWEMMDEQQLRRQIAP